METGVLHWKYHTRDAVKSTPVYDHCNDFLIVGSHGKKVHALHVSSRECVWVFECASSCFATPAVCGECVYVALLSGSVYALHIETGTFIIDRGVNYSENILYTFLEKNP